MSQVIVSCSNELDFNFTQTIEDRYNLGIQNLVLDRSEQQECGVKKYRHVLIDLNQWDTYWEANVLRYVVPDLNHIINIKTMNPESTFNKTMQKIQRVENIMKYHQRVFSPVVSLPFSQGHDVDISGRRHRYWWFKRLGMTKFVAAVLQKDFDRIENNEFVLAVDSTIYDANKQYHQS